MSAMKAVKFVTGLVGKLLEPRPEVTLVLYVLTSLVIWDVFATRVEIGY